MGLEESDGEEKGPVAGAFQQVERHGHDVVGVAGADLYDLVVTDDVGVLGDVLLADERRPVPEIAQRVDDVVPVVLEREPAVSEADHPVRMGVLPCQQTRPAPRAGRGSAERLAEEHPLLGEPLDIGRPYGVAVGPDPPPGVVGVDVEDVRKIRQTYPFCTVFAAARSSYRRTHSSESSSACRLILGSATAKFFGTEIPMPSRSHNTFSR